VRGAVVWAQADRLLRKAEALPEPVPRVCEGRLALRDQRRGSARSVRPVERFPRETVVRRVAGLTGPLLIGEPEGEERVGVLRLCLRTMLEPSQKPGRVPRGEAPEQLPDRGGVR